MLAFSIKDAKTESGRFPFSAVNRASAMRDMETMLLQDTIYRAHHADFSLWEVGSWDDQLMKLSGAPATFVCEFTELITVPETSNPDGTNPSPRLLP